MLAQRLVRQHTSQHTRSDESALPASGPIGMKFVYVGVQVKETKERDLESHLSLAAPSPSEQ